MQTRQAGSSPDGRDGKGNTKQPAELLRYLEFGVFPPVSSHASPVRQAGPLSFTR